MMRMTMRKGEKPYCGFLPLRVILLQSASHSEGGDDDYDDYDNEDSDDDDYEFFSGGGI